MKLRSFPRLVMTFDMNSSKIKDPGLVRDFHNVWHPCTPGEDREMEPPLLIERGQGVYLYDAAGNKYMDVISSWWVNLFGHNNARLNDALTRQLDKVAHVMFAGITHPQAIALAEKLVALTPSNLSRVYFSDNGSTSVEVALKMSLQYWRQSGRESKTQFAYLKGGYHGETLGALSVCGLGIFRDKFEDVLTRHLEVPGPDCYDCPFALKPESCNAECFGPMEKVLSENQETLAAVIVEPLVQGAAGMKMYPPVYLRKLQEAAQENQVHTIFDEVAVGFGRTGGLFVCGQHELNPTFLCLSKGITSGYLPLAATLAGEEIFSAFDGDFAARKFFIHSHSYAANPLACACANETLAMLTENDFLSGLKPKMDALAEQGQILKELPWCGEFRQTGMIAAVELVRDRKTKEPFAVEERVGVAIYREGLRQGVFMRPLGNVVYFIPPLSISLKEIQIMVETAWSAIHRVLKQ